MIGAWTNHLWQSTLFASAAGLLTVAFRKNRAPVRYWLWFSASFKFFVPFSLLMSLGSHLESVPAAQKVTRIATQIATPSVSFTMEQITEPFPNVLPLAPSTPRTVVAWRPLVILGVWTCGFGAIALIRLRAWRLVRAAVRASTLVETPTVAIRTKVQVRLCPGLMEPGVVGLWHPILLLPAGILTRLTPRQLEAGLAHELYHVERRDNVTSAIHMIAEAVFWFHPLIWWIGARLIQERERACDEYRGTGQRCRELQESECELWLYRRLSAVTRTGVNGNSCMARRSHQRMHLRLPLLRLPSLPPVRPGL